MSVRERGAAGSKRKRVVNIREERWGGPGVVSRQKMPAAEEAVSVSATVITHCSSGSDGCRYDGSRGCH